MSGSELFARGLAALLLIVALPAGAQSFRVQCPTSTITHPNAANNNSEPAYTGPTAYTMGPNGYLVPANANGAIKCQQVSGGDGYATMADGTQTFMFSFGPLSGLADIAQGSPGTEYPSVFNQTYQDYLTSLGQATLTSLGLTTTSPLLPGDPATTDGATDYGTSTGACASTTSSYCVGNVNSAPTFTYNGAIGLQYDIPFIATIFDIVESTTPTTDTAGMTPPSPFTPCADAGLTSPCYAVTVTLNTPSNFSVGDTVIVAGSTVVPYSGSTATTQPQPRTSYTVSAINIPNTYFAANYAFQYLEQSLTGGGDNNTPTDGTASSLAWIDGHVDPRQIMDVGVMNGNIPAPLVAFDEDDEMFLTLTNVGMIMRPDLFEQHTIHFHGYPNASSFYDGVPDASVAINIGGSFTYYYLAPDAGTYFWHCHITPPEHLQMGMVGQLYVRPRQNRVPAGGSLYLASQLQNGVAPAQTASPPTMPIDLRTACNPAQDILCSANVPAVNNGATRTRPGFLCSGKPAVAPTALAKYTSNYTYNDGDGSTCYDVEYPIQMHGFDPNFHFVGMTFNPEAFVDMKDKYYLLNGRSYPDTVQSGPQLTQSSDGRVHFSQPLNSIINIPAGGKALLRIDDLSVAEYATLASMGIRMHVVGYNAKLLRDQGGNNMEYYTNSITLGGGESLDVILDASDTTQYHAGQVFFLYGSNLDFLSNDAENFGGLMTEVHICNSVNPVTKACS